MVIDFTRLRLENRTSAEEGNKSILICRNHAGYILTVYDGSYKLTVIIDRSEDVDYTLEKLNTHGDYVYVQDGWTSEYTHLIPSDTPEFAREVKDLIHKLRAMI